VDEREGCGGKMGGEKMRHVCSNEADGGERDGRQGKTWRRIIIER
jgi:hypothetical protein